MIKGHLRALNLIFKPGSATTMEQRVREAKESKSTIIPLLSLLIKDHKELNKDETEDKTSLWYKLLD